MTRSCHNDNDNYNDNDNHNHNDNHNLTKKAQKERSEAKVMKIENGEKPILRKLANFELDH
jgi:hypothetical protein